MKYNSFFDPLFPTPFKKVKTILSLQAYQNKQGTESDP